MRGKRQNIIHFFLVALMTVHLSCNRNEEQVPVLFEVLESKATGLSFSNKLTPTPAFNMLKYMYFYNGAGVAAGDFNNDDRIDLFFAGNQVQNRLYLNKGNLQFNDVTAQAKIPDDKGWSTGVSVADVNEDGLLDIYVCRVGHYETLQSRNQLLICKGIDANGIPYYADEAEKYGLAFSGFSTQAAFLDYDLDGDLDMFLLNHSLRYNSTFAPRESYNGTADSLSGDYLYRNDGGFFTDVSATSGINRSIIGYGLGIVVSDINLDGYPDIYIGNDFHENDYLYINTKQGGFKDELTDRIMHTSQFSMGVDVADINNDAWPEIVAADMLPSDPYILKRSLGEDEYNTFLVKIRNGYNYQYARNTLQFNRRNGMISETGLYSNIYATDWSWATLWMDFDNDGLKDLFVSNGIPKRLNDIDYINYVSNDEIQRKIRANEIGEKDMTLIDKFPQIKLPNRFFRNKGNIVFEDMGKAIGNDQSTYSNGAAYADLDNDGDLDIIVNNIDEPALIYKNTTNDAGNRPALRLNLEGSKQNPRAVGARVFLFSNDQVHSYEKYPVHGFQSAMEIPLQFALPAQTDSAFLVWPDNTYERLTFDSSSVKLNITYRKGLPSFDFKIITSFNEMAPVSFTDITAATGLLYRHIENTFIEFDREPLMPFMASREGPALAVGDLNGDSLQDVFAGASKGMKSVLFIQQAGGAFKRSFQPALDNDSTFEDVDARLVDVNNDGHTDLLVASGGNEYYGKSEYLLPRLYINDGTVILNKKINAFPEIYMTASCIVPHDFDGDGDLDLFLGGRAVPWEYGVIPGSYLMENNGKGEFRDISESIAPGIRQAGMVKSAIWSDIDGDRDADLLLALEWDGLYAFINTNGKFSRKALTDKKGWWNFILPLDIDNDGDMDIVAGNEGLNSRFHATTEEPVRMYYFDFDGNGKKEQIITYYQDGRELPFANKADLEKQMPGLKKKFLYAEDFAKASLNAIFDRSSLQSAGVFTADYFPNAVFINQGNFSFQPVMLPWEAQLTSYKDAIATDINKDGLPDLLLGGNFYPNNIQLGRYDADFGTILINLGKGKFKYEPLGGLSIKGSINRIKPIQLTNKETAFIFSRNDDSTVVLRISK